jgi:hypothetical protein
MPTADEGTCTNPRMVEITMYEDRHCNHVIEARASGGKKVRVELGLEERTPLEKSAAVLESIIAEALKP